VSPSKKNKKKSSKAAANGDAKAASVAQGWALAFYKTQKGAVPARGFLLSCPSEVRQMLLAILVAVRDAPPPSFGASNMWHAMHEEMKGFHEARDEHDSYLYRVFCVLDSKAPEHGLDAKAVALISGGVKKKNTKMAATVYEEAVGLRKDYEATRRILLPMGVPQSTGKP
jgi:hypothetical protein